MQQSCHYCKKMIVGFAHKDIINLEWPFCSKDCVINNRMDVAKIIKENDPLGSSSSLSSTLSEYESSSTTNSKEKKKHMKEKTQEEIKK